MKNSRYLFLLVILILILGSLLVLNLSGGESSPTEPENSTYIDQLDIETDNPQPAGKNLDAPSEQN